MNYVPARKAQQNANTLARDEKNGIVDVNSLIRQVQAFENQMARALPKNIDPSRLTRMIITEVRKNPELAECDRISFFGALIHCARLGLMPGAGLGHAYLIPRWNKKIQGKEVQILTGYQGMIDVAERNGAMIITARVVREGDHFEFCYGFDEKIEHKPLFDADESKRPIIAAYAIAKYPNGNRKFEVLSRYQIEKAKACADNPDGNYSPWKHWYEDMARKTAVRKLWKFLPKNVDDPRLIDLLNLEDATDRKESQELQLDCPPDIKTAIEEKSNVSEGSVNE